MWASRTRFSARGLARWLDKLIVNLVPAGRKASDAEIEVERDRLLDLDPG